MASHGPAFWAAITTYFGYAVLLLYGYARDFLGQILRRLDFSKSDGYAPLSSDFDKFYKRYVYYRLRDCFNRPISSCPGAEFDLMERVSKDHNVSFEFTGKTRRCLNLGSYNYLGFADPDSPCSPAVKEALAEYGVTTCSHRVDAGTTKLHRDLELLVARYVGKPAAMVFGMGFGTNSTGIPALVGKGGLIISDSLNHASIVIGARSSGAKIKVFNHNNADHLESIVRRSIIEGQPKTHRPWTKIVIMIEGIYSMEGQVPPLQRIVEIKKKYNCYLYVDEAHSIGALGKTGRGVCEFLGVSPNDVDVLMGTFTKSFGAVGGYIAGSQELITYMRQASAGSAYSASLSPPCCQQIISAIKIIIGEDGTDLGEKRLRSIEENSNFFREKMRSFGCIVLGDRSSPVCPVMIFNISKLAAFSRECLKRNIAVVVVGFPATALLEGRVRFCISAQHTREQLEDAAEKIKEVCSIVGLRYRKHWYG